MKYLIILLIGMALGGGIGVRWSSDLLPGGGEDTSSSMEKKPLYWVAPMDKNYRRDGPGLSPMGMELVPVYEEAVSGADDNSIRISPAVENNLGVKTAKVTREKLVMPIETVGTVRFDESRIRHIHSRVEGWIERLNVASSGDPVKKGQTLFELYSPALVSAQEEYLAAMRSGNQRIAKASRARLRALGLAENQIQALETRGRVEQTVAFVAEADGIVIDLNVRQGMHIQPATQVLSIGSLDSVWIVGEIFERQAYLVEQGQRVDIELTAMPGKHWQGYINYVYPQLDRSTRTLPVRVRVNNPDHALRPNMLANLRVITEAQDETLTIPRQAVIKAGHNQRVVRSLGEGRYQSVPVVLGLEGEHTTESNAHEQDRQVVTESRVQILDGLSEGDQVVTSAQFLIDSESNVEMELNRMEALKEEPEDSTESESNSRVMTAGRVEAIMPDMGMVTITHDPIPEWEWPTMKMDFEVADSIPLDQFRMDERVRFELEKTGDWDYRITGLSEQSMTQPPERQVTTQGEIKSLMPDRKMLEVVHDPIPEWEWPVMRMSFSVKRGEVIPELAAGDRIRFKLTETREGDYEVSEVQTLPIK